MNYGMLVFDGFINLQTCHIWGSETPGNGCERHMVTTRRCRMPQSPRNKSITAWIVFWSCNFRFFSLKTPLTLLVEKNHWSLSVVVKRRYHVNSRVQTPALVSRYGLGLLSVEYFCTLTTTTCIWFYPYSLPSLYQYIRIRLPSRQQKYSLNTPKNVDVASVCQQLYSIPYSRSKDPVTWSEISTKHRKM